MSEKYSKLAVIYFSNDKLYIHLDIVKPYDVSYLCCLQKDVRLISFYNIYMFQTVKSRPTET